MVIHKIAGFLTIREAAAVMKCGIPTLRKRIRLGLINTTRVGPLMLYLKEPDVLAMAVSPPKRGRRKGYRPPRKLTAGQTTAPTAIASATATATPTATV